VERRLVRERVIHDEKSQVGKHYWQSLIVQSLPSLIPTLKHCVHVYEMHLPITAIQGT
jgi:hypothetical protein